MQPVLTAEQRELIRTACRTERELALVDLLYSSGMRVSEVIRLDRADIDPVSYTHLDVYKRQVGDFDCCFPE